MRGQVSAPSSLPVGSGSSGPDVPDSVRPEHPAGRSGPVRPLTAAALPDRTGRPVRSGSGRTRPASGRSLLKKFPTHGKPKS